MITFWLENVFFKEMCMEFERGSQTVEILGQGEESEIGGAVAFLCVF